ncbi:MAG: hypothetical protein ACFFD1_00905 [Candidatus Thorarchaeota archaeon]
MGLNFGIKTKGYVGEIIYPAYNNTNKWYQKSRWDLIMKTDKENNILEKKYIWNYNTVRAIELILELMDIIEVNEE